MSTNGNQEIKRKQENTTNPTRRNGELNLLALPQKNSSLTGFRLKGHFWSSGKETIIS